MEAKLRGEKKFMFSVFFCEVRSRKEGSCIFMGTIEWKCFDRVLHEECTKTESTKSVYSLCGFRRRLFFTQERLKIKCANIINFLLNFDIFWTLCYREQRCERMWRHNYLFYTVSPSSEKFDRPLLIKCQAAGQVKCLSLVKAISSKTTF